VDWFSPDGNDFGGEVKVDGSAGTSIVTSVFSSSDGLGGIGSTKDVVRDGSGVLNLTVSDTLTGDTVFVDLNISKIVFTSAAQTLTAGTASTAYTIETQNGLSAATNVSSNTTIDLTSSSGRGTFDTSVSGDFDGSMTSLTISSGASSTTFFYKDTVSGTPTITAAENPSRLGYTDATQQQTVNPGALTSTNVQLSSLFTTGVTVIDDLPDGVTYVSSSSSQGTCSRTANILCQLGSLSNGESASVTIVVTLASESVISNTGVVSGADEDPTLANKTDSVTMLVRGHLTVAQTFDPDRDVRAGDTLIITATFSEAITGVPTIGVDAPGHDLGPAAMTDSGDGTGGTYIYVVPAGSDGIATVTFAGASDAAGKCQ